MTSVQKFISRMTSQSAVLFYAVSAIVWLGTSLVFTLIAYPIFKNYLILGFGLGTAAWVYAMGRVIRYFSVSVPEVTGLVTVEVTTGDLNTYETGFHFRSPTEQVKEGNYINMRIMTTDDMQESFPCADGPVVIVKWNTQYRTTVEDLRQYIAVDEKIINQGLNEVSSSFLTKKIRSMPSEKVRGAAKKHELEADVLRNFKKAKIPVKRRDGSVVKMPLEDAYGIDILLVAIADVDFEASYQKARSTDQIVTRYKETAAQLQADSDGTITSKDALDTVLIVAGQGVTKEVRQETRVFDVSPAAAKALKDAAEAIAKR